MLKSFTEYQIILIFSNNIKSAKWQNISAGIWLQGVLNMSATWWSKGYHIQNGFFDHIVWYLVCMRSLHKLLKIIILLCGTSNWDYHSIIMYTMMIGQVQDTEFA